jgi:hypothetical protein
MSYARKLSRHIKDIWEEEMQANREINETLRHLSADELLFPEILADRIIGEMMESDYENAVEVFDRYFGSFVILER